jgi:hypothetical protein
VEGKPKLVVETVQEAAKVAHQELAEAKAEEVKVAHQEQVVAKVEEAKVVHQAVVVKAVVVKVAQQQERVVLAEKVESLKRNASSLKMPLVLNANRRNENRIATELVHKMNQLSFILIIILVK